jgi:hypothetical protein
VCDCAAVAIAAGTTNVPANTLQAEPYFTSVSQGRSPTARRCPSPCKRCAQLLQKCAILAGHSIKATCGNACPPHLDRGLSVPFMQGLLSRCRLVNMLWRPAHPVMSR